MGNVYGYIRVSSRDQKEDRQMIALIALMIGILLVRASVEGQTYREFYGKDGEQL